MKKRVFGITAAIFLMIGLANAIYAAGQLTTFSIGFKSFAVAVPKGFCASGNAALSIASNIDKADPLNKTHAVFVACPKVAGAAPNFTTIRSLVSLAGSNIDRQDILSKMGTGPTLINPQRIEKEASEAFGQDVTISHSIRRLGSDGFCALEGGVVQMSAGDGQRYISGVGECFTSISGKVMMIGRYGSANDAAKLVREADEIARTISSR